MKILFNVALNRKLFRKEFFKRELKDRFLFRSMKEIYLETIK